MRVKCLAQEHNAMTRPGLEPGPSDPESNALIIRPPRHPPIEDMPPTFYFHSYHAITEIISRDKMKLSRDKNENIVR